MASKRAADIKKGGELLLAAGNQFGSRLIEIASEVEVLEQQLDVTRKQLSEENGSPR